MAKYLDNTGLSYLWGKIKTLFVLQTRKINNKALDADITLTAEDVGALTDADMPITLIENNDSANKTSLRSLDSGTYVLKGYFKPFESSTDSYTFSTGMLVAVVKTASMSYVQILYAKGNTVQYLEISDTEVTRKDAKLQIMESTANKVTAIEETSDDYHYPSAKAVYDATKDKLDKSGGTMTGALTLSGDPMSDLDAATKQYVDDFPRTVEYTHIHNVTQDKYYLSELSQNVYATISAQLEAGKNIVIKSGQFRYVFVGDPLNLTLTINDLVFACPYLFLSSDHSVYQLYIRIASDDTISEQKKRTIQQSVIFEMAYDKTTETYSIDGLDTPYDAIKTLLNNGTDVAVRYSGTIFRIDEVENSAIYFKKNAVLNSGAAKTHYFKVKNDNTIEGFYAITTELQAYKVSDIAANATDTVKYPNCKAVTEYVSATKALVINVKHNIFDENNPNPYFVDIGSDGNGIYLTESTENKYAKIMDALKNSVPCVLRAWQNSSIYADYAFAIGGYNDSILFVSSLFSGSGNDSGYTIEYPSFCGYLIGTDNSITATNYVAIETQSNRTDDIESNATSSDKYPSTKGVADYVAAKVKTYTAGDGISISDDNVISAPKTSETWTFTLADGSTVTKSVVISS